MADGMWSMKGWRNVTSGDERKPAIVAALRRAGGVHATARVTLVSVSADGSMVRGRFPQAGRTATLDADGFVVTAAPSA